MPKFYLYVLVGFWCACGQMGPPIDEIKSEIETVLAQQVQGWNAGNLQRFMAGYHRSDSVRFVSGGSVTYGWQNMVDRYFRRYPDRAAMGTLTFSELDIRVLANDAAVVFGKWQLQRKDDAPWGYFTLLFRKMEAGWRIVHDHTSSG